MTDRVEDYRKTLLELYTSISLQYAGFAFAFAVAFFAEVNIMEVTTGSGIFPSVLRIIVASSMPATLVGAGLTLVAYLFTRGLVVLIVKRLPEDPEGKKSLSDINEDYIRRNMGEVNRVVKWVASFGGGIILKWTAWVGLISLLTIALSVILFNGTVGLWH